MMIYIGIDPGKNGGYAVIDEEGEARVWPWDDDRFVHDMVVISSPEKGHGLKACVERVGAMPGQGVSSTFSFGVSAGYIHGVLSALGIPYQLVVPRRWKSEFGLNSDKKKSIEVCRRLFPEVSLKRSGRCRVESDGMAESLLLAEYARRHF